MLRPVIFFWWRFLQPQYITRASFNLSLPFAQVLLPSQATLVRLHYAHSTSKMSRNTAPTTTSSSSGGPAASVSSSSRPHRPSERVRYMSMHLPTFFLFFLDNFSIYLFLKMKQNKLTWLLQTLLVFATKTVARHVQQLRQTELSLGEWCV